MLLSACISRGIQVRGGYHLFSENQRASRIENIEDFVIKKKDDDQRQEDFRFLPTERKLNNKLSSFFFNFIIFIFSGFFL